MSQDNHSSRLRNETFVLHGDQIDELWNRLTPAASWEDKLRELEAVQQEIEP